MELVLQRFGTRGDDDLPPRKQRGREVGKGLTGTGAGFSDECPGTFDRGEYRRGKLQLLGPRPVARNFL